MKKILFLFFLFAGGMLHAQFTVNNPTPQTTDQIVKNILVGAGVTPQNITFNGTATKALLVNDQAGFWKTNLNPTNTGFDPLQQGLLLTTGKVTVALGPNDHPNTRDPLTSTPYVGDADLDKLSGIQIGNVAVLEFDFVATGLELNFDFVFGSEEYPEYVGTPQNDAFGFFLSGPGISGVYSNGAKNIALIPGTNTGVSINTVNDVANSSYYVDNTAGADLQYDGFTKVMRASSALECGGTYHIKLAIGQGGSDEWDSGVLIKNFTVPPMELIDNYGLKENLNVCYGETITISSGLSVPGAVFEWSKDGTVIPGDGPNLSVASGGNYALKVFTPAPNNCMFASDDIAIGYLPAMPINNPVNIATCTDLPPPYIFDINQTPAMLGSQSASDYSITYYDSSYTDAFNGGSTGIVLNGNLANYTINGTSKTIWVRVEDPYITGCVEVKPFDIIVNSLPTISGNSSVCFGTQSQLTGSDTPAISNAWMSSNTAVVTVDNNGLVSAISQGSADITYTNSNGCSSNITITVLDLPTVAISGGTTVCVGTQAAITFNGTPNAIVTYTVDGVSNETITLDPSGTKVLTTQAIFAPTIYSLISVATSGTPSCSQPQSGTVTVSILASPTATISGTTTICQNDTAPIITFTGANGIAPYAFTYSINNGASKTIATTSGDSVTVSAPTTTAGTFVYELISVSSSTTPSCSQSQTGSATVNVIVAPNATISYSNTTFCITETAAQTVNFSGTLGGYYSAMPAGLSIDTTTGAIIPSASTPGKYTVTYHVNPSGGCPLYNSSPVSVEILSGPTASISYSGPFCESLNGQVAVVQTGATGGVYTASPNGLTIDASTGAITPSSSTPGNYTVSYTVVVGGGCPQLLETATVVILEMPNPNVDSGDLCVDPDTNSVLPGSVVTLDSGLNSIDYTFEWYDSSNVLVGTKSAYQANKVGNYTLIAKTLALGTCSSTVTMTVGSAFQAKIATATVSNYFEDSKITVSVVGDGIYIYELDKSGTFQESNIFNNVAGGLHTVTVQDTAGCTNIVLSDIMIIDYPRYFTPNGDGNNETWNITSLKDQQKAEIFIFDRYGKLITQIRPKGKGWDGTYNGLSLPSTDYWFTVRFIENGVEKIFRSHFSLKR